MTPLQHGGSDFRWHRSELKAIAAGPFASHPNVKALRGEPNAFRLCQGDWRALYRVDPATQEVRVYVIETRARAYR